MAGDSTLNYPTLRRTRATLRVLAPILSVVISLAGLSLFAGSASRLTNEAYALSERIIFGVIGLVYLLGLPLLGFVSHFALRAAADLIDVWVDGAVAAERTADLVERQLVPGVDRLCRLLECDVAARSGPEPKTREPVVSDSDVRNRGKSR